MTNWQFTYKDFDGLVKSGTATVHEPREGEFYATGAHGCSKTYDSAACWKPIRAALQSLVGADRPLITYSEIDPVNDDRDLAHEADMRALRREQLRADIGDDNDVAMGDPDEHDLDPIEDEPVDGPLVGFDGNVIPAGKASYRLEIRSSTGYEAVTVGTCDPGQYGLAMAALHGSAEGS